MSETWNDLALDNRRAANVLVEKHFRSAIARAYYAVFAKLTQELRDAGTDMPVGWEGPTHKRLRPLIEQRLSRMELNKRVALSEAVGRLYTLRIDADYKPSVRVSPREAREAISIMKIVFEAFSGVWPLPTVEQIPEIVEAIKARLDAAAAEIGVRLQVTGSDLDDEWLYVMVTPDQEGIRASDHATLMSRIERELRARGYDQLLLVPTLTDM